MLTIANFEDCKGRATNQEKFHKMALFKGFAMSAKTAFEGGFVKRMAVGFKVRRYWCLEEVRHLGTLECDCSIGANILGK